jgi:hypothetical protein
VGRSEGRSEGRCEGRSEGRSEGRCGSVEADLDLKSISNNFFPFCASMPMTLRLRCLLRQKNYDFALSCPDLRLRCLLRQKNYASTPMTSRLRCLLRQKNYDFALLCPDLRLRCLLRQKNYDFDFRGYDACRSTSTYASKIMIDPRFLSVAAAPADEPRLILPRHDLRLRCLLRQKNYDFALLG